MLIAWDRPVRPGKRSFLEGKRGEKGFQGHYGPAKGHVDMVEAIIFKTACGYGTF
jgi:hypothetical protein